MTKAQEDRRTDFAAVRGSNTAMRSALRRLVRGYRGERSSPVTTRQIRNHFAATGWDTVNGAILDMLADGELDCAKSSLGDRAATVYYLPETQAEEDSG